ncbi:MAG: FAD-dependent monooxygenase [Bacteroidota bacterium]
MTNDKPFSAKEVFIIGGGLGGIATALSLQQRGIIATILETSPGAKRKVGETLPPSVAPILQALGIRELLDRPEHLACYGNTWQWGNETLQEKHFIQSTLGHGWHVQREILETDLQDFAHKKGIQILTDHKLLQLHQQPDESWLMTVLTPSGEQTIPAGFIVDATGRSSKVARCLGIERRFLDELTGTTAYFSLPKNTEIAQYTYVESVENGWWYAAVLGSGELVTAFMTDARLLEKLMQEPKGYWQQLQQTKLIRTVFPEHYSPDFTMKLHTQSAGTSCLETCSGANWLAVGDAAFAYDPVSSYGMTSALGSGYYAGQAIADCLSGEQEALDAYRFLTEKTFADYVPMWQRQYSLEQRWKDSPFWKARNH